MALPVLIARSSFYYFFRVHQKNCLLSPRNRKRWVKLAQKQKWIQFLTLHYTKQEIETSQQWATQEQHWTLVYVHLCPLLHNNNNNNNNNNNKWHTAVTDFDTLSSNSCQNKCDGEACSLLAGVSCVNVKSRLSSALVTDKMSASLVSMATFLLSGFNHLPTC